MNAAAPSAHPRPALIVVSGGGVRPDAGPPEEGSRLLHLLDALPPASRVLEIGGRETRLSSQYTARHPHAEWMRIAPASLAQSAPTQPFDLIVIDRLDELHDPVSALEALAPLVKAEGELYASVSNKATLSSMARLIEGDLSSGVAAYHGSAFTLDQALPRWHSPSTVFKLMLDAGWTPHVVHCEAASEPDARLASAARAMGEALGVPQGVVDKIHRTESFVVRGRRQFEEPVQVSYEAVFDVLVPTNKEQQLRVNVEQSPGLSEVAARIISYRGAATPAEALEGAQACLQRDWVLLCHQDVYFPRHFGHRLNALLSSIPEEERARTLIGFVGMGVNRSTEAPEPAGFVVDRLHTADHPESDAAISIDELAIVVARDSLHRIDPRIGWHLWATDLCLTAICEHRVFPRIVRMPVFHNSQTGWHLPDAFVESAAYLLEKFPTFTTIHSLCGQLDKAFVNQHRKAKT